MTSNYSRVKIYLLVIKTNLLNAGLFWSFMFLAKNIVDKNSLVWDNQIEDSTCTCPKDKCIRKLFFSYPEVISKARQSLLQVVEDLKMVFTVP